MKQQSTVRIIDYDPSNPKVDFKCGNSMFSEIEWDFNGCVDIPHLSGARLMVKFQAFEHKPKMLEVVKLYMVYELSTGKIMTAKRNYDGIVKFIKYVDDYFPELDSFSDVTQELVTSYFTHLLEAKSETTGKPLSATTIKKAALAIREILLKGLVREWDVPEDVRYLQSLYDNIIINNKQLKKSVKKAIKEVGEKVVDEKLIELIIKTANEDLKSDRDILTAAAIIITSQIGLRISEIITIETGCLKLIGGDKMIDCSTTKLDAERISVMKPANELVELAVTKLEEHSKPLREESGLPYLFLNGNRNKKGYPAELVSHPNWNKNFVRPWIKKHNLIDPEGKFIDFTSHTFRHAFATYALRNGASLESISALMNHKSIRGTQHYTHLIEEEVKKKFAQVLHEGAILSGKKALQIKDKLKEQNPFKGKTVDQVDKLRKAMKIQVLSHGLCLHHPMRNEPCEGDGVCLGCQNFITTPEFLEVHKGRLKVVRENLVRAPETGPFEAKLKHMESYLVNIIKDLENQMDFHGNQDNASYKVPKGDR